MRPDRPGTVAGIPTEVGWTSHLATELIHAEHAEPPEDRGVPFQEAYSQRCAPRFIGGVLDQPMAGAVATLAARLDEIFAGADLGRERWVDQWRTCP